MPVGPCRRACCGARKDVVHEDPEVPPPPYPLPQKARGWFDPLPTGGGGSVVDENARNTLFPLLSSEGEDGVEG